VRDMGFLSIVVIIIISIIMGLTDFFGHKISGLASKYRDSILSLSSGLLISILFVILIPDLILCGFSKFIFLFMLIGFLLMHFSEKYIYRHITDKQELLEDLKIIHIIGFGIDNFLVGFIIASIAELNFSIIIDLSFPLFLQMLSSSISLDSIDTSLNDKFSKIILSILPLLGSILGIFLNLEELITIYILAFVLGILLYLIIRDVIPQGRKGKPLFFFFGNLVAIIIWMIRLLF
jgi:ZIP family zinc transporter